MGKEKPFVSVVSVQWFSLIIVVNKVKHPWKGYKNRVCSFPMFLCTNDK